MKFIFLFCSILYFSVLIYIQYEGCTNGIGILIVLSSDCKYLFNLMCKLIGVLLLYNPLGPTVEYSLHLTEILILK